MKKQNTYDTLNRPTNGWTQNNAADTLRLTAYAVYGEQATTPSVNNLLGKLWQQYNESGKVESIAFDFKGNLLSKQQAVISSTVLKTALDSYQTYLVDWTGLPAILGTQIFETSSEFDALNRATKITLPEDVNTDRKEIIPTYNRAGALEKVTYDSTEYVENIAYNAKGQRLLIAFGNNIMTRYAYDNLTFRLLRQRSEKYVKTQTGNIISYTPQSGTNKQDDGFNFDLIGNILTILHRVNDCGISGSSLGSDALDRNFEYDPLYRVTFADGRESDTQHENDYLYTDAPAPGTPNANNVRAYTRQYDFDKLGNIQQLKQLGTDGFTRNFTYNTGVNTLQRVDTATPSLIEAFTYDVCGNQLTAGTTRNYVWNAGNQLITYYNQAGSADPTIFAQYDYAGQNRVSKMVRTGTIADPIYERIIYIDGIFEYHILENGTTYEKNYVHIMDASTGSAPSRVAMIRIGTAFPDDIADAITYTLENQIGSSVARLDTNGTVIDKEEYYPFGDSSLRTFTKKRYRYVGKEKDLESGLYYYGARYFSPWIARFISCDPLSAKYAQLSPYNYADNNPINDYDIDGMQTASSVESEGSGPVKNPFPVAKDASGKIVTNQETGEPIRPSVNAVEVHYTGQKNPMEPASTLLSPPDLSNPFKADNIIPVIQGNFAVESPSPQQFYFEKPASKETQEYWAGEYKMRELSSGPMRQFMIAGKSLEIGYEIASTVEGVGAIKKLSSFALKKAFSFGSAAKTSTNVLSKGDLLRIENAATRINKPITVVGSRAKGTAGAYSDWDYVIPGLNSKNWSTIKNSLPGSRSILDNTPRNIDIFKGPLDVTKPHIIINPRP